MRCPATPAPTTQLKWLYGVFRNYVITGLTLMLYLERWYYMAGRDTGSVGAGREGQRARLARPVTVGAMVGAVLADGYTFEEWGRAGGHPGYRKAPTTFPNSGTIRL